MTSELFTFTDHSALYATTATWLIKQPVWEANRVLDESHVAALQKSIQDPRSIQGPFSVVMYTDELTGQSTHRVIDGQHRREVLARYFAANPDAPDFPILCRRYVITDNASAVAIFQQINFAKPMVYKGSPEERLHAMVVALQRAFVSEPNGAGALRALIRPGCNRPALNTEHLETALRRFGIPDRTDITPADVVAHAEKMNAWYAEDESRLTAKMTRTILDRARDYGFYLGLDSRCPWLMGLTK
jgi:hypothetical protein